MMMGISMQNPLKWKWGKGVEGQKGIQGHKHISFTLFSNTTKKDLREMKLDGME
jgi:hypothetical protein